VNTTGQSSKVSIGTVNDTSKTEYVRNETLALTISAPKNEGNHHGNVYKGWFIPPASTNYTFWMACDDYCILKLGKTPGVGNTTVNVTVNGTDIVTDNVRDIIQIYSWSGWRDYFKADGKNRSSGKIYLEANQPYYLETNHIEGGGGDNIDVAVEIESNTTVGHYHAVKEQ
jgi:hypothetical protein